MPGRVAMTVDFSLEYIFLNLLRVFFFAFLGGDVQASDLGWR